MGARIVPLHGGPVSQQLADIIKYLQQEIEAGRITGLAFAAKHQGQDYSTAIVGECRTNPVLTRGMIRVLEDEIAALLKES